MQQPNDNLAAPEPNGSSAIFPNWREFKGAALWSKRYYPSPGEPGYESWKAERNARSIELRNLNPEKARERGRKHAKLFRERYPERVRANNQKATLTGQKKTWERARYSSVKDDINAKRRARYKKDPSKKKAERAKWYALLENKAKVAELGRKRYLSDPERFKKAAREHAKNNLERFLIRNKARELRKKGLTHGNVKVMADWAKRWRALEIVRCYWCLVLFSPKQCEIDHIVPLDKNGPHSIENLCISCEACNGHKSSKSLHYWNKLILQPVLEWNNNFI